jgi:hypothetical protein
MGGGGWPVGWVAYLPQSELESETYRDAGTGTYPFGVGDLI